jgi:hypothetical protein
MLIGANQNNFEGWTGAFQFNERFVGVVNNSWTQFTSAFGSSVGLWPAANLDADKWPNTLPAVGAYVDREVYVLPNEVLDMTWQGNFASQPFFANGATITNYDPVARTATVTVSATPSAAFVQFKYTFTDTVNYPKNIKMTLHGSSGRFTPKFMTELNRYNGNARFVKWVMGVEGNNGVNAAWGGGTYTSPVYSITPATRNTPTGGCWRAENSYNSDGIPYEVITECVNAYTGDGVHINVPYVASDAYITNLATYLRDNVSVGKTIFIEFSNEVWNGVYPCSVQANAEARDSTVLAGHTISSIVKGTPVTLNATGTSHTTNSIDGFASTAGISNGMAISGPGVSAGTIVIATNTHQVTLSQPTTTSTTASFTFSGCPATVTTASPHGLTSTQKITVTAASPSDYNVLTLYDVALTVNSPTTFTYMCATTPATNATVMGSYTTNLYPHFGVGGADTLGRYVHASKRCHDIFMSVFAGQTSRIKPMLCFQHGGSSATCATVLNYANTQGWLSNIKALATAPYWYSQTYPASYTGSAATFLADCKTSMQATMFTPAAGYKAVANTYGWDYVSYEGDYGAFINDLTTQTNIKTDPTMYDTVLFYLQNMAFYLSRLTIFNFCEPIAGGANGGYGHIFPNIFATVNKTNTPGLQAIIDYISGIRAPLPLSTTGLTVAIGASNGTSLGTITGKDLNSVLSLAGLYSNDGGIVSIDGSTGQVTLANTTLLTTTGIHNITVRDSNAGYPAPGYVDTNFTYNVTQAVISDNFNGAAGPLNSAIWVQDSGFVLASGQSTTGIAISQDGTQAHIVWGSPGGPNHGNAFRSINTTDITQLPTQYAKFGPDNNPDGYERSFIMGNPGGVCIAAQYSNSTWSLYSWIGGSSSSHGASGGHASLAAPWVQFRYTSASGGTIFADYSTDGVTYTNFGSVTIATLQALGTFDPTSLYIGFGAWHGSSGNIGSTLGINSINTAP